MKILKRINFDNLLKVVNGNKYILTIAIFKRAKELFKLYPSPHRSPASFIDDAAEEIEGNKVEITYK